MSPSRRRVVSAMATASGTSLAAAGVAFVVNILMARALGPESRGDVAWVLQSAYVLSPLISLGVNRKALRGEHAVGRVSQAHVWLIGITCAVLAAAASMYFVAVCLVIAALGAALSIERGAGMASGRLQRFFLLQMGVQTWVLLSSVALYVNAVTSPMWWIVVYAAPAPVVLLFSLGARDGPRERWQDRFFGSVSRDSLRYMVGDFAAMMAGRVERLILPVLASPAALGLYVVVATASEILVWLAHGLGESRVATFVRRDLRRTELARIALRDLVVFTSASIPLAFAIKILLIPLFGPAFAATEDLVFPLCFASAAWATYLQMSSAWLARGSAGQSVRLDVAAAALTALLTSLLIPEYEALGAAYGCLAAYLAMVVAAVVLLPLRDRNSTEAQSTEGHVA